MHQPDSKAKAWLDDIIASANSGRAIPDSVKDNLDNRVSGLKRFAQNIDFLPTEQKINAGMWGVGALLAAFGFARSVGYTVQKDEKGENHVQWSNVGIALLQAAMTAGCAYMGVQAVRAGAVR